MVNMSGTVLKRIAAVTMLIDHFGAAFFYIYTSSYDGTAAFAAADMIYDVLRIIGRTSFPLFCFLLVEGVLHTRSVWRYLSRLFVFAIVSEIPFDLAFHNRLWDMRMQNVFFTLLLGVLALTSIKWGWEKSCVQERAGKCFLAAGWLGAALCAGMAYLIKTDYDVKGVVLVVVLYFLRIYAPRLIAGGYMVLCYGSEIWSFPGFLLMMGYNGERGNGSKYFFYFFYPLHLLVLAGVRLLCL